MEVFLDGEKIFDKKGEGNIYPDLARIRMMKLVIDGKIASLEPVAAAGEEPVFKDIRASHNTLRVIPANARIQGTVHNVLSWPPAYAGGTKVYAPVYYAFRISRRDSITYIKGRMPSSAVNLSRKLTVMPPAPASTTRSIYSSVFTPQVSNKNPFRYLTEP